MNIDLEQLAAIGGVISAAPIPEEITWKRVSDDGDHLEDVFTIHVRKLAYIDQERIFKMAGIYESLEPAEGESNADFQARFKELQKKSANAALICVAVRLGDDATEELSYENACRLHPSLAAALLNAIYKVNPSPRKKKAQPARSNVARAGA